MSEAGVRRILFVDDEPLVLAGLQRMLRPMRSEWQMAFVESGAAALELLGRERFDVVVSDMRMPGMDGSQLLSEVMNRHPHMVRIILSGHSDKEMILRSVGSTHQFLSKPCEAEMLKQTVLRACGLREILTQESLTQLVSRVHTLPSLPTLYRDIIEELQSPSASIQKVGQIISRDIGMSAKILQLVNSAFFGLRKHVSTPLQAVNLLGLETIKALVLSSQVFGQFEDGAGRAFDHATLWRHSVFVGTMARRIALSQGVDKSVVEDSLTAGLLHDLGVLLVASQMPDAYREVEETARARGIKRWEAEQEVLGATHAGLGGYLLGLWALPTPIVEAVALHHSPQLAASRQFTPLTAVHAANAFDVAVDPVSQPELCIDYLVSLDLHDRIPVWQELCVEPETKENVS